MTLYFSLLTFITTSLTSVVNIIHHIVHAGLGMMSFINLGINFLFDEYLFVSDIPLNASKASKLHPDSVSLHSNNDDEDLRSQNRTKHIDSFMRSALKAVNPRSRKDYSIVELNCSLFNIMTKFERSRLEDFALHWGCQTELGWCTL